MAVRIMAVRETREHERRVALVPAVAKRLQKLGVEAAIERGAGAGARIPDGAYEQAGMAVVDGITPEADIVLAVQPLSAAQAQQLREGSVLLSFVHAHREPELVRVLRDRRITCFAMELVPRISRAQPMDALSSQAALAGYWAAIHGATLLGRILPMMTTAVGSLRPAKCLVMGCGVAGLQAIATARRLGAMVEGYDVRGEVAEQVASLGAKWVDTGVRAEGEGGYARELTEEEKAKVAEVVTRHLQAADLVITTAAIPGRPSPKIVSRAQIEGMKPGSVIVDLAAEGGGNTECTRPGEIVTEGPALISAPLNVPSRLAEHASELYAKNLVHFLELIVADGALQLDWEDEILARSCLTHDGQIRNEQAARAVEQAESGA